MEKKKLLIIVGSIITVVLAIFILFMITSNKKPITYEVTFETDGGTLVTNQTVNEGEKVKKPVDPTRDGYIFAEWTYKDEAYDFNLEVTSNLILIARWVELEEDVEIEQDVETFSIKFNSDGGSAISDQIIEKGNKVEKPNDPTKEGYVFKGWTLNDEDYNFETIVESNFELKAKWEEVVATNSNVSSDNKNTSNNNSNNNNASSNNGNNSNNASSNNSNNNNNNNNASNNNSNNNNTTKPEIKKYTVTFNSNGGSAVASQTITEGSKATKPGNPTRSGYNFAGWTLNGSAYNFNSAVTGNITLVANWNEVVKNKYTVTFNSNGGSAVSSQTVTEGGKVTRPSNPTRSGYNFGGWLLNGSTYDFNSSVNSNITLTAKWNQKLYTVKVSSVDQYSPDRILTVYEDGTKISVSSIKYNGVTLCSGSNMVVNMYEISGISTVTVVLNNGTSVTASVQP